MKPTRNYSLLLSGQFLSAFGDNAILMIILGPLMAQLREGIITPVEQQITNIIYTSLLFIPYVLLAPLAGYLNDRFAKERWLMGGNFIKLTGTALAALSVMMGPIWLGLGYFIVGVGACVYSPAKYGILPEILPEERLVKANGTVELLTLIAILAGNISGALMFDHLSTVVCYLLIMAVYGASLGLNAFMTPTPSYPEVVLKDSVREFFQNAGDLLKNKRLARVLVGTSTFWICGALLKMNFQPWGQQVLKLQTATDISLLGLWLSIGVMAGSVLAGQLYRVGDLRATRRWGWLLAGVVALLGTINWLSHHGLGSTTFSAASFNDMTSFAKNLKQPSNAVSTYLNFKFSEETRRALANYQGKQSNIEPLQKDLIRDLNAVITGEPFYNTERFAKVNLSPETKRLLELNKKEDLVRFHRSLLEDAYPSDINNGPWPRAVAIAMLILTGLIAGLFLIPLNAALQAESHKDKLGKTIATQNGFENLAMICGSIFAFINVKIGLDPSQLFLGLAAFVFLVVAWVKIPSKAESTKEHYETDSIAR